MGVGWGEGLRSRIGSRVKWGWAGGRTSRIGSRVKWWRRSYLGLVCGGSGIDPAMAHPGLQEDLRLLRNARLLLSSSFRVFSLLSLRSSAMMVNCRCCGDRIFG